MDVRGRRGDFSGKVVRPGYHKQDVGFVVGYYHQGVFLFPFRLERFTGKSVEVHGNARMGQFLKDSVVEITP